MSGQYSLMPECEYLVRVKRTSKADEVVESLICSLVGRMCFCEAALFRTCTRREWALNYQKKLDNYNTLAGILKGIHQKGEIEPGEAQAARPGLGLADSPPILDSQAN